MDMLTAARNMGQTNVMALLAPGQTYSPVDAGVQFIKKWTKPVFDDNGNIEREDVWVRYRMTSVASAGNEVEDRLSTIMDVGHNDDPDHLPTNILKARREAILRQMKQAEDKTAGVMPDDHMPLRKWGALTEPVVICLEANGIHSVQHMRDASETKLHTLPQGLNPVRMREMARIYLDNQANAAAGTTVAGFEARIIEAEKSAKAAQERADRLEALLEQAVGKLAGDAGDEPKRRGRPPKSATDHPSEVASADVA